MTEPLGDPRAPRHDAVFLELEHSAQVHLGGVDEVMLVVHVSILARPDAGLVIV
jgi:hypothetical protein